MRKKRACIRVSVNAGNAGDFHRLQRGFMAGVTEIDQHADPLHFSHHFPTKSGKACVLIFHAAAASGIRIVEGDQTVPNAQLIIDFNHIQIALQTAQSFKMHQYRKLVRRSRGKDVVNAFAKHRAVINLAKGLAHVGNTLNGFADIMIIAGDRHRKNIVSRRLEPFESRINIAANRLQRPNHIPD